MQKLIIGGVLLLVVGLPASSSAQAHESVGIVMTITGIGLMFGAVDWNGCGENADGTAVFKDTHRAYREAACIPSDGRGVFNPGVRWHPGDKSMYMLITGANLMWVGIALARMPDNPVTKDLEAGVAPGGAMITKSISW